VQVVLEEVETQTGEEEEVGALDAHADIGADRLLPKHCFLDCISPFFSASISFPLPRPFVCFFRAQEVLYSQRAKLFVFAETMLDAGTGNKSWKERGIGNVRLLRHKEHSRIRVLMRQEKTHKLIINHALLPGLRLVPHATSDKSVVWRAEDFSDGASLVETDFCVRFASSEIATAFKEKFEELQGEMVALYAGLDAGDQAGGDEAADALASLTVAAADGDGAAGTAAAAEEEEAAAASE
jgi:Ran-binding protein 1